MKISLIATALASLMLSSCFTGIESTPKITQKDVKRQNVTVSAEQSFTDNLRVDSFSQWRPGRQFRIVDNRLSLLLDSGASVNAGDTLTFVSTEQRPGITGDSICVLSFMRGDSVVNYRVETPLSSLRQRQSFQLPFAVDLSLVARADSLLRGKSYYVKSPLWVDADCRAITGSHFVPVTIYAVEAGTDIYPLWVKFFQADASEAGILMTVESSGLSTRNFSDLFAFDNPRQRYPQIADDVWQLIIQSDVREGMTRDECRLSLGIPRDVRKSQNGSYYYERWTYENGSYLIFEDGLLQTFRR
jgi:hypothetical protein